MNDIELQHRYFVHEDETAFTHLFERHAAMVLSVARRVLRSEPEAEDVLQETFLLFAKRAKPLNDPSHLPAWLYGVAWRKSIAKRRTGKREQPSDAITLEQHSSASDDVERMEVERLIDSALRELPAQYQTAIVLAYFEGRSHDEVADHLGSPRGSISGYLARGLALLKTELSNRGVTLSISAVVAALSACGDAAAQTQAAVVAFKSAFYKNGKFDPDSLVEKNEKSRVLNPYQRVAVSAAFLGAIAASILLVVFAFRVNEAHGDQATVAMQINGSTAADATAVGERQGLPAKNRVEDRGIFGFFFSALAPETSTSNYLSPEISSFTVEDCGCE